jgi:WD40 repeat protein/class 3 adenylate cyclase/tRNA A-37 threonylcarbamoyl transferase component Bud32
MEPHFLAGQQQNQIETFGRGQRTGLLTLLFTDMVGSTAIKQQLGDRASSALFDQHHQLIRHTLQSFVSGQEIETAGDSFLVTFSTPSDAVQFALLLQARLRRLSQESSVNTQDRIGIHVGEVVLKGNEANAKPNDLYGIQIDTCSRVMSLAKAGQVLMTRAVFDNARQLLKNDDIPGIGRLEWLNHGPYLLKGLDAAVEVCEVREAGSEAGGPPTSSEKAQREVRADEEPILGWRPALGQLVPNTRWVLEKKLGEGGFGEVWLGRHSTTKQAHVFKFCFQAQRVRFLKRELTLFRLLKERVGDHPNIVAIHDVYLDKPPFYVEMDYVEGSDLRSWCEEHGGIEAIPPETRLEVVAQAAEGLQAAHEAGVIHRDIKPANLLVEARGASPADVLVKLSDFGIGQVVSEAYLSGITRAGFTQTILSDSSSSRTGTQLYMAPELLAGSPASIRSDIYSLGVVLYQLLVGDFARPITTDWVQPISDPLLRDDLKRCFAGNPQDRFIGAGELAKHLRELPGRRAELARREAEKLALERAAYRRGVLRTAGVGALIVIIIAGLALISVHQSKRAKSLANAERQARLRAEDDLYVANISLAQAAWEQNNIARVRQLLDMTASYPRKGFEWFYWQRQIHLELRTLRGHGAAVCGVAFSPDGTRVVTCSFDKTAKVWDPATGKERLTLSGHSSRVTAVAFSPGGDRIVTGSDDHTAKVWDATNGRELLTLQGHAAQVRAVAYSPDGQKIVTGSVDQTARVWDPSRGNPLLTVIETTNAIGSIAFSKDGTRIVTSSGSGNEFDLWVAVSDHTAKVWDASNGKLQLTLSGHASSIKAVTFSPDGKRILTGSWDNTAKLWDATSGQELLTFKRGNAWPILSVAFSPDGQRIATGSYDQTVTLWDVASGKQLLTLKGHSSSINSLAFSPNGQQIATAGGDWMSSADHTAKVWDAGSDRQVLTLIGHTNSVHVAAYSPTGERIVTGSSDGTVKIWEASSGKELFALEGHSDGVNDAAFSPDATRILTASGDRTAKVWNATTGRLLLKLGLPSTWAWGADFSPDGHQLVTAFGVEAGSNTLQGKVWDAANGKELLTLKGEGIGGPFNAAYSPDGKKIVTAGYDGTARIWDAATGKMGLSLSSPPMMYFATFSPDGHQIVTCGADRTATVWDAIDGRRLVTLKGHADQVMWARFSPDGRRIVTAGSFDRTAKVWDATSGRELLTLKGHGDAIRSAAFSPDGQHIVTGSFDHTAKVWTAATPQQVAYWQREERESEELRVAH